MATTAEIVIILAAGLADVAHVSELVDDQVVLEDIAPANCSMPLGAVIPKLKPKTVTDSPVPAQAQHIHCSRLCRCHGRAK